MNLSDYYSNLSPSPLRRARQIAQKRIDGVKIIDASIGSIKALQLPKSVIDRYKMSFGKGSITEDGSLPYAPTDGLSVTKDAFRNVLASFGIDSTGFTFHITSGGSQAMRLAVKATCGAMAGSMKALAGFSPMYANYLSYAKEYGIPVISVMRHLHEDGMFDLPDLAKMEKLIEKEDVSAIVVIPYDNPSGSFLSQDYLIKIAKLCVKHDLWLISDEAYLGMSYGDEEVSSLINIDEKSVPGITGRRITILSFSKIVNGCGGRVGALVTDNDELAQKAVNHASSDLGAPLIDQWAFGALADLPTGELKTFIDKNKDHYRSMAINFQKKMEELDDKIIVSKPTASIYLVVDFKNVVKPGFNSTEFVNWVAEKGSVELDGKSYIFLTAPMSGFYQTMQGEINPGDTQVRVAFVENPELMNLAPEILCKQLQDYEKR